MLNLATAIDSEIPSWMYNAAKLAIVVGVGLMVVAFILSKRKEGTKKDGATQSTVEVNAASHAESKTNHDA